MRTSLVFLHRWVGLTLTLFLIIAGATGSLLAFNDEIDTLVNPQLMHVQEPANSAKSLHPLLLRERVKAQFPNAWVHSVPLKTEPGKTVSFYIEGSTNLITKEHETLENDQIFVDPYTGNIVGMRKWGDISQGFKNLLPFIYRLHYSLALGIVGSYLMGIIGLLWTLDCFVGFYLTLPVAKRRRMRFKNRRAAWWPRWKSAWLLRWKLGGYRLNFDLHRAGGLWTWTMLFVLAWSSVCFNFREVYNPAMRALFQYQSIEELLPELTQDQAAPQLSWAAALLSGRELMKAEAKMQHFIILYEDSLSYDPHTATFNYTVHSDRDVGEKSANTRVYFDANSGARRAVYIPTHVANGDTIDNWIMNLHTASVWGLPMQLIICAMGMIVTTLSITGLIIWFKKRGARLRSRLKLEIKYFLVTSESSTNKSNIQAE